ncbi:MAG: MFS transporter [Planctomycetota bacterium]|nr:MFS transporter [Planctomycetota bacterium]
MQIEPHVPSPLDAAALAAHRKRGLFFLGSACAAVGCAMAVQTGLNSNFVAQEMALSPEQQGWLEACRETCGITALAVLAVLTWLAEPLIGAGMLVLLGVGVGSYAYVHDYAWLIAASLVWSQGLHVWMPLPNSMTLALAEPGRAGYRLGQMQAAGNVGSGVGLALALALSQMSVPIRPLYLVAGGAAILAGAACLGIPRQMKVERPRLVFRWRYGLYYLLCFLEGWRKQICIAFAGYLLVKRYGTPLPTMLVLFIVIQILGWVAAPRVGKWIDRVGEKQTLVFYYASLTVFFVCYAMIESRYLLWALFIVDSVFFVFTMALTTYVNRIAPKEEHTPTLSMGVAMNHIASVAMPLIGGLLWQRFGYQWAFLTGVAAAACSILVALRLPSAAPAGGAPVAVTEPPAPSVVD